MHDCTGNGGRYLFFCFTIDSDAVSSIERESRLLMEDPGVVHLRTALNEGLWNEAEHVLLTFRLDSDLKVPSS